VDYLICGVSRGVKKRNQTLKIMAKFAEHGQVKYFSIAYIRFNAF
jgi:hypothetical protein